MRHHHHSGDADRTSPLDGTVVLDASTTLAGGAAVAWPRGRAARLGEHPQAVLLSAGPTGTELERLREAEVLR